MSRNLFTPIMLGVLLFAGLIGAMMWGMPTYNVYHSRMAGEAELAQATYTKQVSVQTAQATLSSASLLAQAEIERAKGVRGANDIIAGGLGGPDGYLRYLYIDMLRNQQDKQIIYVPTEATLPVLEAGRYNTVK